MADQDYTSHVMRKPVYAICEQQRRESACACCLIVDTAVSKIWNSIFGNGDIWSVYTAMKSHFVHPKMSKETRGINGYEFTAHLLVCPHFQVCLGAQGPLRSLIVALPRDLYTVSWQFHILFNNVSVISEWWRLCATRCCFNSERILPPTGFQPITLGS